MVSVMQRYVAFLRGIAPSGKNMTNDKLCGAFLALGLKDVRSVLASGNITFRAASTDVPTLEQRIEDALRDLLGVRSCTIIRAHAEMRSLVQSDPFPGLTHESRTYLTATFLKAAAALPNVLPADPDRPTRVARYDPAARAVLAVTDNSDPREGSGLMRWLEKTYGKDITTRSWLTVQRVLTKLED
jgi:uncharacterized protein (DUF1697 family)